jgi:hypothetical protein
LESEEKKKTICQSQESRRNWKVKKSKTQFCQNQELGRKCRRLKFSRQELKENKKD